MTFKNIFPTILAVFIVLVGVFIGALFLPWRTINWGTLGIENTNTVTVVGKAESKVDNQVATLTAGVEAIDDDQNRAVEKVNTTMTDLVAATKEFGIPVEDIKTQSISVYQNEEMYYDQNGVQKSRKGQWRVSNNVDIKLSDISGDKPSQLTGILLEKGATNVWGPNFAVEDEDQNTEDLTKKAMADAVKSAEIIAIAGDRKLGKVLTVIEGVDYSSPIMYDKGMGGGSGMPMEPGSSTISKFLTVTFELK